MVSPFNERAPDTEAEAVQGPEAALGSLNAKVARRQKMVLLSGGGVATLLGLWFVIGGDSPSSSGHPNAPKVIETDGLVNRDLSQKEFVAIYGNRLDAQARQLKALEEAKSNPAELQQQIDMLRQQNAAMQSNGTSTIDAMSAENTALRQQLANAAPSNIPSGSPLTPPAYGPGGGYDAQRPGDSTGAATGTDTAAAEAQPRSEVKLLSFTGGGEGGDKAPPRFARPETTPVVVEDSPDYLPPNSYAPARVIVGVDASAGVASQTDPLPVVLRITGPARSVISNGKLLTTRIQGCVVNGAARGDLSAEKVYVKLAKMTCDQPGGRVAVSEVKGFISFGGKTGVRGRVVSREGNLVSQALIAGIVGGFGRGFSANASSIFSGIGAVTGQKADQLSSGDIVKGGLGQGAGDAADTVSKYLIERAEQYQPVIEMPTGIDVEIVFLDGVYVRNTK
jgi:conjugal transfer pilus assembly protein TraB